MSEYANPKFFDFNFSSQNYGGSINVSSGTSTAWYATDGNKYTRWNSNGQGGTNNLSYWQRDFGVSRTLNRIYVYQSNIININCVYGTSDTPLPNLTVVRSQDQQHHYFSFDTISTTTFKLSGTSTIIVGAEKYINDVIATTEIGTFEYPVLVKGKKVKALVEHKLDDGKKFIINKGNSFEGTLDFKNHISTNDVSIYNTLVNRDSEFYIWINGGNEDQFKYKFYPYQFQDIFKVSIVKTSATSFKDNYYKSGLTGSVDISEVN